jgi:hypothetical protein
VIIKVGVQAQDAVKGGVTIRVKKATNSENALIVAQKEIGQSNGWGLCSSIPKSWRWRCSQCS